MTQREGITPAMLDILSQPTPKEEIRQRQGPGGKMLDYVDARFVMDRLDQIGPENWQDQFVDRADGSVRCGIGILVEGEWVWKWDVGTESDIESVKGSYSEGLKRAGVKWGIARDLYSHAPTTQAVAVPSSRAAASPAVGAAGRSPRPAASTVPPEPEDFEELFDAKIPPTPARTTQAPGEPPTCPAHHWAMKAGKKGGWYCSGKNPDGSWCEERVA